MEYGNMIIWDHECMEYGSMEYEIWEHGYMKYGSMEYEMWGT